MKKRILSILLTLCMVLCIVPTSVFAEGEATTGTAAIQFGTDAISVLSKNANTATAPTVYFGQDHENNPGAWRIIGYDGNIAAGITGHMTLLAANNMGLSQFGASSAYADSDLKGAIDTLAGKLTAKETDAVEKRTLASGSYNRGNTDCVAGEQVDNAVFWPLSTAEAFAVNQDLRIVDKEHQKWASSYWWLRSPGEKDRDVASVDGFGNIDHDGIDISNMWGVRPAFNLNLDSVLFASAAVGGKPDGFNAVPEHNGNEWKLTLKDSNRKLYISVTKTTNVKAGESLSVEYFGADTGDNEYISAMIADKEGNILYYGHLAHNSERGVANITVPSDLADGNYTLKMFSEQCNGDYKTDYAGEFKNIAFTVNNNVDEQFTLTPGDRYYFDLSALDIPGTVNDALPDKTMHYVPFTYAGTVNAYSLKNEADSDTGSYMHSLFIADCNATNSVTWSALNEKKLIYGKTYTSGSVNYTLRAPSVGNVHNGGYGGNGSPSDNEWDAILGKGSSYIKNWYLIASWGQDIWTKSGDGHYRSIRGYTSQHFCDSSIATADYSYLGFRPVLELPSGLDADSLKVVEVWPSARIPGESRNYINIVVKKGGTFAAPSAEGLIRPSYASADAKLWWKDENGNIYKPGDPVPASVSELYDIWGGIGLFLDRGDGPVEVTPDNCTDIFGDGSASFVLPQGKSFRHLEYSGVTQADALEIYSTGKHVRYGSIFPNLKLKNTSLISVTVNDRYIGDESPLFITLDGENTIKSVGDKVFTLSVLGDGTLTLNCPLTLYQYTQYGGNSVTMTKGLNTNHILMDNGSLTVTNDTQAVTMSVFYGFLLDSNMRLFTGSSAKNAAETVIPPLSAEMQELYRRALADETLTNEENNALNNALSEQWDKTLALLSGKTYVRITNSYNIAYHPGTNGTGKSVTDIKLYGDDLTLRSNLFTRTGYTQIGWATSDGGEKVYGFDAVYTQNESLTLYPVWNTNKYTITFDTAGGSEIASITQDYGATITAPADPTREGYTFIGWDIEIPETMPAENIKITARWKDSEKPTGEIKIGEDSKKTFFNDAQTVTISASDNSGDAVKIEYLLSVKELTEEELGSADFTVYTEPFSIEPDNECIIYVRLTDTADNISYIRSDAVVLDSTNPVISGIEDGRTYCEARTVIIDEKHVDTVTVNGTEVTLDENNSFVLSTADGEQRIVAADKAGNTVEMTVTVNDRHTLGNWESNGDSTHTRKCTVDGCNYTETENCSGGKAACTEKAVCDVCGKAYGELDATNHSDLKHIDAKAATMDAEGNIEYWYCEGCGKYYSDADAAKEITKADTVTAKLPDDSKSPQTGDNSNLMQWFALLFISGGICTTLIVKRKKIVSTRR